MINILLIALKIVAKRNKLSITAKHTKSRLKKLAPIRLLMRMIMAMVFNIVPRPDMKIDKMPSVHQEKVS